MLLTADNDCYDCGLVVFLSWTTSLGWLDAEHIWAAARTAPRTKFCSIKVYLTQRHIPELLYLKSIPLHITASGGIAKMSSLRHNNTTYQLKCIEEIHDNTCVVPVDVRRCSNRWQRVRLKGMPTRAWAGASQRRQGRLSHPLRLLEVFREYERLPRGSARGPMVQLSSSFMERIGVNEDGIATLGQEYLHSYDDAIRSVSKKVLHPTIPVNKQYNFSSRSTPLGLRRSLLPQTALCTSRRRTRIVRWDR
jgi:hypothetical protein